MYNRTLTDNRFLMLKNIIKLDFVKTAVDPPLTAIIENNPIHNEEELILQEDVAPPYY